MNRRTEHLELTSIAKILITAVSLGHLIFTGIHVKALLLLENEICGFVMFLFVLFGLVAMFETTRIKENGLRERVFTAAVCLLTAGFGGYLTAIYRNAIANQRALETANVSRAVVFSTIIIAVYVISAILLAVDLIKRR